MHLSAVGESEREWQVAGYIDDNMEALKQFESDYSILGRTHEFEFQLNDLAVLAVATPKTKRTLFEQMESKVEFFTFVSRSAVISKFSRIGRGCILGPNVIVGPNVSVGDAVFLNSGTMIGHDVTIGAFSTLMANNNIAGGCSIGSEVYCASSATVIPNRRICDGAFIGAGSVVIRNVSQPRTVYGNPAKYL